MTPTESLYLSYLVSTSKTALRDFLDALGQEAEDAQAEALGSVRSVCSNSDSLGIGADRDDVKESTDER